MVGRLLRVLALGAALAGFADAAEAHKLKVFAAAEGATISGYAYFVPGDRARAPQLGRPVTVHASSQN